MRPAGFIWQGHASTTACAPDTCYSPALLQQAYDFPRKLDGSGQTILIVVLCGGSPTISDDLATFDSAFGIPAPPSLTTVPDNVTPNCDPDSENIWGAETSASVEYAHALAPGAAIVLVVSPSDDVGDVVATEQQFLPQYPGAIVSQSFGDDETDPTAQDAFAALHDVYAAATSAGGTILASAGDFGATDGGPVPVASYPASDPLVTGVGGTEGDPYPGGLLKKDGKYGNEQVWNESDTVGAATGGAPSGLYDTPDYQTGLTGVDGRAVPDVAYNAAVGSPILVYFGGWGFSAGKDPLGAANTSLYAIARNNGSYHRDFHDIRNGNNSLGDGMPGFNAGPGYDLATGLGTPDVANLIRDLVSGKSDHKGPGGHPHPHPKPGPPGPPGPGPHHLGPDN
jgi:subtilase family serine protease